MHIRLCASGGGRSADFEAFSKKEDMSVHVCASGRVGALSLREPGKR